MALGLIDGAGVRSLSVACLRSIQIFWSETCQCLDQDFNFWFWPKMLVLELASSYAGLGPGIQALWSWFMEEGGNPSLFSDCIISEVRN